MNMHIINPPRAAAPLTGLSTKAMLAGVTIKEWSGKKLDREATNETIAANGAEADAGRFNKALIPPAAFGKIREIAGKARKEHYARTLPWHDNGNRVLSNVGYLDFTAKMRELSAEYDAAVSEFIAAYPVHIAAAQKRLGDMFDASEFPAASDLPRRFSFAWQIWPMPEAADFRVDVGQVEAERIRADIQDRTNAAIDAAMGDAFQRVADVVGKMAERLASDREIERKAENGAVIGMEKAAPIFRDSLVENVAELAALLPSLNITGNPALAAAADKMKALGAIDLKALRSPKVAGAELRQETAKAAADIIADISAFMA